MRRSTHLALCAAVSGFALVSAIRNLPIANDEPAASWSRKSKATIKHGLSLTDLLERTAFARGYGNPPIVTNFGGSSVGGGPVTILGTNLGDGVHPNSVSVWCGTQVSGARPQPTANTPLREFMPVTAFFSGGISVQAGPYDAGTYDCQVENNPGGGSVPLPKAFNVSTQVLPTNSAICGAAGTRAWYQSSAVLCSGSPCNDGDFIDTATDLSGHGYTITFSGTARPIYHSASAGICNGVACFSGLPVITCDGVNDIGDTGAVSGLLNSTTNADLWMVVRDISFVTSDTYGGVEVPGGAFMGFNGSNLSPPVPNCTQSLAPGVLTFAANYPFQMSMYVDTGTALKGCNTNNSTPLVTGASFAVGSGSSHVSLCGQNGLFSNSEITEEVVCNVPYDSTKWANMAQYLALRNTLPTPRIDGATNVADIGGFWRWHGQGFTPGATIAVSGGLEATTAATVNSTSSASSVIPPGSYTHGAYTITLTNPDGSTDTSATSLRITAADFDANTISHQDGIERLFGLWDPDNTTWLGCVTPGCPDTTKLNEIYDTSFFDYDHTQPSSGNQPVLNVADPAYTKSGVTHNSFSFDGVSQCIETPVLKAAQNPFGWWGLAAINETGATTGQVYSQSAAGGIGPVLKWSAGSGKPSLFDQNGTSATATWGSSTNGIVSAISVSVPAGASPTLLINVANSGSPVTQTTTVSSQTSSGTRLVLGGNPGCSSSYGHATIGLALKYASDPGATIKAKLEALMQARNAL